MNEKFLQLYDYLSSNNMTDLTARDFYAEYGDPNGEKYQELFSYLYKNNLTDLSMDEFNASYFQGGGFADDPIEKKNLVGSTSQDMASMSEDGSSDVTEAPDGLQLPNEELEFGRTKGQVVERQKAITDPFRGTVLDTRPSRDVFEGNLDVITADLIDQEEQYVVPELNYLFNEYGFNFEQSGIRDAMKVRADNGASISIDLDPATGNLFGFETKEANKLKKFLQDNRKEAEESYNIGLSISEINAKERKIQTDLEYQNSIKLLNEQSEEYRKTLVDFAERKRKYEEQLRIYQDMSPQERAADPNFSSFSRQGDMLLIEGNNLSNMYKEFEFRGAKLDRLAADYTDMKATQGDWTGGFWNAFLRGSAGISAQVSGIMTDIIIEANPMGAGYDEEDAADYAVEYAVNQLMDNPEKFEMGDFAEMKFFRAGDGIDIEGERIREILKNPAAMTTDEGQVLKNYLKKFNAEATYDLLNNITVKGTGKEGRYSQKEGYTIGYEPDKGLGTVAEAKIIDGLKKQVKYFSGTTDSQGNLIGFREQMKRFVETGTMRQPTSPFSEVASGGNLNEGFQDLILQGLPTVLGSESTTKQWDAFQKKSFWGGALLGVTESLPAMMGGGGTAGIAQRTAQMYLMTSNHLDEEMRKDPAFDNISENEKYLVKMPVGVAVGVLEAYGFRNIVSQIGLLNGVVARAIGNSTSKTTAKEFGDFIRQDVDNMLARGLLTMTAGGLAEFETGAAQEFATMTVKEIYNMSKNKDMFQQPDTFTGWAGQIVYAGAQEAVGGFILGTLPAVSNATYNGRLANVDDDVFQLYEAMLKDDNYEGMLSTKLKNEVNQGKKTQAEADAEMNKFLQIKGVAQQIPADMTLGEKKIALELLLEKQLLENESDGKAKSLSERKQNRIKTIENTLRGLQTVAAEDIQTQREIEATIPDIDSKSGTEVQVETEEEISDQEKADIREEFGMDAEQGGVQSTPQGNIFMSRKGNRQLDETVDTKSLRSKVISLAQKGASAISQVLPDTKIILHETTEDFVKQSPDGRGFFNFDTNTIHINLEKATATTVPHEIFHAVLYNKLGETATGKAVVDMVASLRTNIDPESLMAITMRKFEDSLRKQDPNMADVVVQEELMAEVFGVMASEYKQLTAPQKSKIVQFVQKMAQRFGLEKYIPKSFGKSDTEVIDLLNTLSQKVATGEQIQKEDLIMLDSTPYGKSGMAVQVNPEKTQPKSKRTGRQQRELFSDVDFAGDISSTTLEEFNNRVKGQLYAVTSDATKVGFDSRGNRIDGGVGYLAIEQNLKDDVGFASIGTGEVASVLSTIKNRYPVGSEVGVMVMIQNPTATVGNLYGGKYFHRGLMELKEKFPKEYDSMIDELIEYNNNTAKVRNPMNKRFKDTKESKARYSQEDMNTLLKNPEKMTELEWSERFVEVTTFPIRREMLKAILPDTKQSTKGKIQISQKFQESDYTIQNFLEEFGSIKILGRDNLLKKGKTATGRTSGNLADEGGFIVGGFIVKVPEDPQAAAESMRGKGFTHPQFKGKYPSVENFIFDGLYDIQENFLPFAKPYTQFDETKISVEEVQQKVRDNFTEENDYTSEGRKKPMSERGYTDLTTENKIIIKELNREYLKDVPPNLKADVARMVGFEFETLPPEGTPFTKRGRQQKEMAEIIIEGRNANFRDSVIEDFLVNDLKMPLKLVREVMSVKADLFEVLPRSFRNVKGGVTKGAKLYQRVKNYEQKLIKGNKRRKVKLTEQQIADKTIEYLQKQPEYIAEAETYKVKGETKAKQYLSTQQAEMMVEFQKSVGTRPTEFIANKIRMAKAMLRERKRGARGLQKVKSQIRNFMRKSLPADIYTKSEVMKLMRELDRASEKTVEVDGVKTTEIEDVLIRIEKFVLQKNTTRLENKINKLLNQNYVVKQSGRVKGKIVSARVKDRIDNIKKLLLPKDTSPDKVAEVNGKILNKLNKLQEVANPTEAQLDLMTDLEIALQYNETLNTENDMYKLEQLDFINHNLSGIIDVGRSELKQELAEQSAEYTRMAEIAYEEITGVKRELGTKEQKQEADFANEKLLNKKRNAVKGYINQFANTLATKVKTFFNRAEALDGLMDLISKMPGEMFGGRLQEMITARVDKASRDFKQGMMMQEQIVEDELRRIYGKKWKKFVRENNKLNKKGEPTYVLDRKAVDKAAAQFDNGEITESQYRDVLLENAVYLNQNQMAYYYNLYKDPKLRAGFRTTFGPEYARIMDEIQAQLDPKVKEFADWQVEVMYPALYERYNEPYRKIYRTNLPWNEFYAGMVYRDGVDTETLNILDNNSVYNTAVGAASTKARVNNDKAIKAMNNMNVMSTYLRDMEYFRAYGEVLRDIDKTFKNKQVKDAISAVHGDYVNTLINDMISKIASKGVTRSAADRFVNTMNNLFIISRIGLNPTVMIKQLTSMITYANDIGYRNWLKYSLKNIPQIKKTFNEISENSVYMQDRNRQSITRVIESYTEDGMMEFVPNQYWDFYVNFVMYSTKFGDKAAIYLGGMPNYLYYKEQAMKQGKSEEQAKKEAIIKFERDTKRTQQSMDLQDRDYFQTAGALQRGLNMFLTTPKQYLRKEIQSTRNLYRKVKAWDRNAGKGTLGENLRTFATYHILAPVLFQYVALGLPGLFRPWRDDDEEDLMRAAIIGNLNALFIVGEAINITADVIQDKPWAGQSVKSVAPLMMMERLSNLYMRYDKAKDPEKKQKALEKFTVELLAAPGIPAVQIQRFLENMEDLGKDGDIGTDILRLLNYSKYQIEGMDKSSGRTKTEDTDIEKQRKQYQKDLEKRQREYEQMRKSPRFKNRD